MLGQSQKAGFRNMYIPKINCNCPSIIYLNPHWYAWRSHFGSLGVCHLCLRSKTNARTFGVPYNELTLQEHIAEDVWYTAAAAN